MPLLARRRRIAPAPSDAPLVRLREVAVRIGEAALLAPLSLELEPGEVVAVTGPNGSGKTTLLRVIAGLTPLLQVPWTFDPQINIVAFAISAVIVVVFGYFPARRAAALNPIDALRHE